MAKGRIYQRGKVWWIDYSHNGRRFREPVGSKSLAEQALAKRTTEIAEGRFFPNRIKRDISFVEMADMWYRDYSPTKKSHKNDICYVEILKSFFPHHMLSAITGQDVQQLRVKLKDGGRRGRGVLTVNRFHQKLKSILNRAREWGYLAGENPACKVRMPSEKIYARDRYLDEDELIRLDRTLRQPRFERIFPIVMCALLTGMRKEEIAKVKKKDVNLDRCDIHLPDSKPNEPAYIVIPDTLFHILEPIVKNLASPDDRAFNYSNFAKLWKQAKLEAGIKNFRLHDSRHTYASYMTMETGDLAATQRMLRQKTPAMAQRYSHHAPQFLRGVAGKLDKRLAQIWHKDDLAPAPEQAPQPLEQAPTPPEKR